MIYLFKKLSFQVVFFLFYSFFKTKNEKSDLNVSTINIRNYHKNLQQISRKASINSMTLCDFTHNLPNFMFETEAGSLENNIKISLENDDEDSNVYSDLESDSTTSTNNSLDLIIFENVTKNELAINLSKIEKEILQPRDQELIKIYEQRIMTIFAYIKAFYTINFKLNELFELSVRTHIAIEQIYFENLNTNEGRNNVDFRFQCILHDLSSL